MGASWGRNKGLKNKCGGFFVTLAKSCIFSSIDKKNKKNKKKKNKKRSEHLNWKYSTQEFQHDLDVVKNLFKMVID